MKRKPGISQQGLKLLACLTMLIDHLGAIFFPGVVWMRILGRLSFPIYCFLLAEGIHHTRSPKKYALRLLLVAIVSELPYDLLFRGEFTWAKNSVMVTLLLGFCMGMSMKQLPRWTKIFAVVPFAFLARYCHGTYGANGVLMIAIFLLTRELPCRILIQTALLFLLSLRMAGFPGPLNVQIRAVLAMIPIALYSGEKGSRNPRLQWCFTLFYPLHIVILLLIRGI